MIEFKIKIPDIEFKAEDFEDAEAIALDIVNDIGHDGNYEVKKLK